MKHTSLIFEALLAVVFCFSCKNTTVSSINNHAPSIVEQFYDNVALIAYNPDSDEAFIAKEDCIAMCKVSDASWNFPNEFRWMGLIDREDSSVSPISYISLLRKFSMHNNVIFFYQIENSFKLEESIPDSLSFWRYIVSKEYRLENYKCSFIDTVLVSPDSLIVGIKNISGGHAFTLSEQEKPIPDIIVK